MCGTPREIEAANGLYRRKPDNVKKSVTPTDKVDTASAIQRPEPRR
jgi:hypothetical protein